MFAIVQAIGWPIWPLIFASVVALALIIERSAALRRSRVLPSNLLQDVLALHARRQITSDVMARLERSSLLGFVLAAGLRSEREPREIAAGTIEVAGARAAHEMSRYLTLLGSVGSTAPLLGLLGTVVGMIDIFASQQAGSNPQQLAQGISVALYSTAFGIIVAGREVGQLEAIGSQQPRTSRLLSAVVRDQVKESRFHVIAKTAALRIGR